MLLKNKIALVYGAGGSIGGAVASAFAREGAKVFVSGRTLAPLQKLAETIMNFGGFAETAVVDALDEKAVVEYVNGIAKKTGSVDISFNAIGLKDVQGIPLIEMKLEDYLDPIMIAMKTQFITAAAAGHHMTKKGSGVILSITATPAGMAYPLVGGFGPACSAIEAFSRNLAAELGPQGVRAICLRSAGSPDSAVFVKAMAEEYTLAKTVIQDIVNDTMLKKLPLMSEIANAAVFAVSDHASAMTGTTLNLTCGTTRD